MTARAGGGTPEERLRAWAYLSRVVEGPCTALIEQIDACGPIEVAAQVWNNDVSAELEARTRARRAHDAADHDLATLRRLGGRLVTPDSPEWPAWRTATFSNDCEQPDGARPVALWVLGALALTRVEEQSVAIVGTRAASGYGEHVAAEISADLAAEGYAIVSGAAYGIDGAAHRSALAVGGDTVAVLACGLDRVYPSGHARLLREIAARGVVVSEYPPGTVPGKHRFLSRNRLVAGFADATVIVEAGRRSGAANTARWAVRMHRHLLAVPGPVTSATSAGCHALLRGRQAEMATGAADVIDVAGRLDPFHMRPGEERRASDRRATDRLTPVQLAVHDGLPASGGRTCEEVAREAGVPVPAVMSALAVLELHRLAVSDGDTWARARGGGRRS